MLSWQRDAEAFAEQLHVVTVRVARRIAGVKADAGYFAAIVDRNDVCCGHSRDGESSHGVTGHWLGGSEGRQGIALEARLSLAGTDEGALLGFAVMGSAGT